MSLRLRRFACFCLTYFTLTVFGMISSSSAAVYVYVSKTAEQEIQVYRFDSQAGTLDAVAAVPVGGAPGVINTDPTKKFLYASIRSTTEIAAFQIDPATGKLTALNRVPLDKGANATYVATDRTGKWLLSASYTGGKVAVHGLNDDGSIKSPAVQVIDTAKTAHCIGQDRENRFVFVPHVSTNSVFQFRLNVETGELTDAGKAPGGAEKAGPRHIALHPKLDFCYVSDEVGSSITAYRFDASKGLTPVQTLSTLPDRFDGRNTTAEIKIHPTGKYAWVSNRGHESLAGFTIAADGKLTAIGHTPTEQTPRSFEITPDGKHVFGAGEGNGKLAVFKCDVATGKLQRIQTSDVGKSLTWVRAVELGK